MKFMLKELSAKHDRYRCGYGDPYRRSAKGDEALRLLIEKGEKIATSH